MLKYIFLFLDLNNATTCTAAGSIAAADCPGSLAAVISDT